MVFSEDHRLVAAGSCEEFLGNTRSWHRSTWWTKSSTCIRTGKARFSFTPTAAGKRPFCRHKLRQVKHLPEVKGIS